MLCKPPIADGITAIGNTVDYCSGIIILSTVFSFGAELHACSDAGEVCDNAQATMTELTSYTSWSIQKWINKKLPPRGPVFVVVDAKGLWIQDPSRAQD